jgi:hypothetical protein
MDAPVIQPPEGHEPQSPVRVDASLGRTEDLDRYPDGVPHQVVGLTALFSVMLAMLVVFMFLTGTMTGRISAAVLVAIAVPVLVGTLRKKADRDRDHLHPSR